MDTDIRHGLIPAHAVQQWVVDAILDSRDLHWSEHVQTLRQQVDKSKRIEMQDASEKEIAIAVGDELNNLLKETSETWEDPEPEHAFDIDGVKGQTIWIGGTMFISIEESPIIVRASSCAPFAPNCGNLTSITQNGIECCGVPPQWLLTQ